MTNSENDRHKLLNMGLCSGNSDSPNIFDQESKYSNYSMFNLSKTINTEKYKDIDEDTDTTNNAQVVKVPLVQEVNVRERIIEVPEVHLKQKIKPKVIVKDVIRKIPKEEIIYKEKIVEVPEIRVIDKYVSKPVTKYIERIVPKIEYKEIIKEVPKIEIQYVEKIVEVPEIKIVDKIVEVPKIHHIVKEVPKIEVEDVQIEKIVQVPKVEIQLVEKERYVLGPVEYIDIPIERITLKPVPYIIEKVVEVPVPQEIVIEVPIFNPVVGDFIDIPVDIPVTVEKVVEVPVQGRIIPVPVEVEIEKIVEVPIEVPQEHIRVVSKQVPQFVEKIRTVEVPQFQDEVVEVKQYVPFVRHTIIKPVVSQEFKELPPVVEQGSARYIKEPPQYLEPEYVQGEAIEIDEDTPLPEPPAPRVIAVRQSDHQEEGCDPF
ncbi:uncharacterized protein CMU_042330 [Cryptosporidium muris RN66]|uniref:Inner membrane complex protein n=1 Tax=Cryptosporidium muris (strain RN66) TaxID=441375 RepID=B6AAB9_CRYMR|nr:uncharacterized protein CMU_042330 [Cryptosporidium muris RN66]EEA05160.1 hypothetical protein, conserved [Cryptosporidium muris RN66]|eukprot:XP_002139509.1 hypothetical protein [Cryptosporidium muris RN66]